MISIEEFEGKHEVLPDAQGIGFDAGPGRFGRQAEPRAAVMSRRCRNTRQFGAILA
jgi:hypothetical protein